VKPGAALFFSPVSSAKKKKPPGDEPSGEGSLGVSDEEANFMLCGNYVWTAALEAPTYLQQCGFPALVK
jgi:hypothetical protein